MSICFRDRTFCDSDCTQKLCWRHFSESDRIEAKEWGGKNAPIAWSDFSKDCSNYKPPKPECE